MRIGLLRHQQPFAEFDPVNNRWRVWYIYNNDVTSGTYYDFYNDGTCDRVTVADRDVVSISRVANAKIATAVVTNVTHDNNALLQHLIDNNKIIYIIDELEAKALWQDGYEM